MIVIEKEQQTNVQVMFHSPVLEHSMLKRKDGPWISSANASPAPRHLVPAAQTHLDSGARQPEAALETPRATTAGPRDMALLLHLLYSCLCFQSPL